MLILTPVFLSQLAQWRDPSLAIGVRSDMPSVCAVFAAIGKVDVAALACLSIAGIKGEPWRLGKQQALA